MSNNRLTSRPPEGTKVRCVSKNYSHDACVTLVEIGEVYTVDKVKYKNSLGDLQMTFKEINERQKRLKVSPDRPIYHVSDFEEYVAPTHDDNYDRAMSII